MADITLHTRNDSGITCVSNAFIDEYMKDANGEFVKIYIYLLRLLSKDGADLDISSLAEKLDHTEKDIRRALDYWESKGLLYFEYNSNEELIGICLQDPSNGSNKFSSEVTSGETKKPVEKNVSSSQQLNTKRNELSVSQMESFKEENDTGELLYVLEKYLGHNLTISDISTIYYWINELHFNIDLIYYLAEYCIDKGHPNIKYMDSIAIDWSQNGISTIPDAKEDTIQHSDTYRQICKSFGIQGRNLIKSELDYLAKWKKYDFNLEVIDEACRRTIVNTNKANFEYADKILSNWASNNVSSLADINSLDEEYKANNKKKPKQASNKTQNKFNNFDSRNYDFDKINKALLNN